MTYQAVRKKNVPLFLSYERLNIQITFLNSKPYLHSLRLPYIISNIEKKDRLSSNYSKIHGNPDILNIRLSW